MTLLILPQPRQQHLHGADSSTRMQKSPRFLMNANAKRVRQTVQVFRRFHFSDFRALWAICWGEIKSLRIFEHKIFKKGGYSWSLMLCALRKMRFESQLQMPRKWTNNYNNSNNNNYCVMDWAARWRRHPSAGSNTPFHMLRHCWMLSQQRRSASWVALVPQVKQSTRPC